MMRLVKWLYVGVVFALLGGCAAFGARRGYYQPYVYPEQQAPAFCAAPPAVPGSMALGFMQGLNGCPAEPAPPAQKFVCRKELDGDVECGPVQTGGDV